MGGKEAHLLPVRFDQRDELGQFGDGGIDLRDLLDEDADRDALTDRVTGALGGKAAGHRLAEQITGDTRHLAQLGG